MIYFRQITKAKATTYHYIEAYYPSRQKFLKILISTRIASKVQSQVTQAFISNNPMLLITLILLITNYGYYGIWKKDAICTSNHCIH